jgi:hypothetical protein
MTLKLQNKFNQSAMTVVSLLVLMFTFVTIPILANAQTAQPKPEIVDECPTGLQQLHFDALIMEGGKTQKVWYLHNDEVKPGQTCVVINGWTQAGPAGWEPMKGEHEFILTVSVGGSTQKLIGDSQADKRIYVIDIPANHDGLSWVCNHAGHFIHSGGSVAADGTVVHNGIMKVAAK